ncbi:MAG: hypothetical protein H8E60_11035 [Candidatus Marinimicrobia bacterium]|nr:hypothetical protein [Candidatus Neomarinimicrobiota bacterium]
MNKYKIKYHKNLNKYLLKFGCVFIFLDLYELRIIKNKLNYLIAYKNNTPEKMLKISLNLNEVIFQFTSFELEQFNKIVNEFYQKLLNECILKIDSKLLTDEY